MAKRNGKLLYPYPVIVGFFGGGEQIRMSVGQPVNKPWRFPQFVKMVKGIIGDERARAAVPGWHTMPEYRGHLSPRGAPAEDLLCYYVEWHGAVYRDEPQPSPAQVKRDKAAARIVAKDPARKRVVAFTPKAKPAPKRTTATRGGFATKRAERPPGTKRKATRRAA